MLVGYCRVSTQDQTLNLQLDALQQAGCEKTFQDVASGAKADRPGLLQALGYAREGDTLVVWRLDRLGRSLKHLIEVVESLERRGIGFKSLREAIDTTTSGGKLVFHIFCSLAEFERQVIQERTKAGLEAARARGRKGGRRQILSPKKIEMGKTLASDPNRPIQEICKLLQISTSTYYRYIHEPKDNASVKK
jgi:DNA invertase Pin-like site-specific DNA recombinase